MKPFQLNPQQLEALHNGATKLLVPAKHDIVNISTDTITFLTLAKEEQTWDLSEYLSVFSPLQPGESYFVQEEFMTFKPTKFSLEYRYGRLFDIHQYKSMYKFNDDHIDWQPADQMTEAQSQYKFTVTGVEVKYANLITLDTWKLLNPKLLLTETFISWHDSQYPDQPYSSSPTGFLITIERIEDAKEN